MASGLPLMYGAGSERIIPPSQEAAKHHSGLLTFLPKLLRLNLLRDQYTYVLVPRAISVLCLGAKGDPKHSLVHRTASTKPSLPDPAVGGTPREEKLEQDAERKNLQKGSKMKKAGEISTENSQKAAV